MAKYRNISGEVQFVGHLQRAIEPDEVVVDIDDGTFRLWPDSLWEPIGKLPPLPEGMEPYPDPNAYTEPEAPTAEPAPTAPTSSKES